jgi:hypothetical protein
MAGNAKLLQMELREQGIPTATVESIVGQAGQMTGLIEQLLHFGRAHDQPVQADAVDAGEGSPAPPHTRG